MPRDGSGVASKPANTTAAPNTTIESAKYNSVVDDLYALQNEARPITAGGTGATSAVAAADNLSPAFTDIASATTPDIGAAISPNVNITGTTTITGFASKAAGALRVVKFAGALTLTHNGTSFILPGGADIRTAAGDVATFISEGGGNWRCLQYQRSASQPSAWERVQADIVGVSNQTEIKVQNLSAYVAIRFRGVVQPVNDGVNFRLKVSADNGSTYYSATPGYTFSGALNDSAVGLAGRASATNSSLEINQAHDVSNGNTRMMFEMQIDLFNKGLIKRYSQHCAWVNSAVSKELDLNGSGRILSTSALNCIQITTDLGNLNISHFVIEGIRG